MLKNLFKQDIRFQYRHGFYWIYAFVTVLYCAVLLFIPIEMRDVWTVLVLFSDPGTFGFFFVGAIVLLERNQKLLSYLFVTPVKLRNYLLSKLLSLTVIAWLTSVIISLVAVGGQVSLGKLTLAVILISGFFTLFGLLLAISANSMNHFMFRAIVWMVILYVPLLQYAGWVTWWGFEFMPGYSAMILLDHAVNPSMLIVSRVSAFDDGFLLHSGLLFLWGIILYVWTYRHYERHIRSITGEDREVSA